MARSLFKLCFFSQQFPCVIVMFLRIVYPYLLLHSTATYKFETYLTFTDYDQFLVHSVQFIPRLPNASCTVPYVSVWPVVYAAAPDNDSLPTPSKNNG